MTAVKRLTDMSPDDVAERLRELDEIMTEVRQDFATRMDELRGLYANWKEAYDRKCREYGVPGFSTPTDHAADSDGGEPD
jgi:hypothetical protein